MGLRLRGEEKTRKRAAFALEYSFEVELVDETGVEPATSSLRTMRSPS